MANDVPDLGNADIETKVPKNMIEALEQAGIFHSNDPLLDDGGNRVEVECTCNVKSTSDIATIVEIAKEMGYGVMPIGSLTSAVSAFKSAATHGLKGWVGIKIDGEGRPDEFEKIEVDGNVYETISILKGQGRILKSKSAGVPNRVQVWGGTIPDDINDELVKHLGKGHSIYLDLTTRDSARIAAVVATGGQGPVREDAGFNLHGLIVIDKDGKIHHLKGQEAKRQVGLGGLAGAISEVDMEIVKEQPYEFGLFIPFPGSLEHGLTEAFPSFMAAMGKFTESEKRNVQGAVGDGILRGKHDKNLHVKGFEIVTRKGIHATFDMMKEGADGKGGVGSMLQFMRDRRCETGLMINGRTSMPRVQLEEYLGRLYEETDISQGEFVDDLREFVGTGLLPVDDDGNIDGVIPFSDGDMNDFRKAREGVAVAARESKKEGPTKSTDLNLKVSLQDPAMAKIAYQKIWAIYHAYVQDADARDAQIYIYGHNYPGNSDKIGGGGVDAHIRVTFPLKEQDHQSRAAENMAFLEGRLAKMYEGLISLDGESGITIAAGEKGNVSSTEYTRFLEEKKPQEAADIFDYIEQYGGATFGARNDKFKLHARPIRMPGGLLNYFAADEGVHENPSLRARLAKSITLWCQNSHRSPEAMNVFTEVIGLLRDYFNLDFDDRIFYAQSPEKALHMALVSLTDYKNGGKVADLRSSDSADLKGVSTVVLSDTKALDDERFAGMKKVLCIDGSVAISVEDRKKADVVVYSAESFGTGGEMGIIITSMAAVKYSRELAKKGNNVGYVHAFDGLNKMPHSTIETPKMQVIAELGLALAEMNGQTRDISPQVDAEKLQKQESFVTFNPGPSQIHPDIIKNAKEINASADSFRVASIETRIAKVEAVKAKLREFLQIPKDYEIFFSGSATQSMEQIVASLGLDHSIVLSMGAFGDRQQSVVGKFSKPGSKVKNIQMRWGTGPNSRMDTVVGEVRSNQPRSLRESNCGFFMTGHETSTGVQADVSALSKRLDPSILKIVDGTSEAGAVSRTFEDMDIYFGSFQKFFGVPSGIGFMVVSPRAMRRAQEYHSERNPNVKGKKQVALPEAPQYGTFVKMLEEAKAGKFHNLRGILQVERALDDFILRGGIDHIAFETKQKIRLLSAALLSDYETDNGNRAPTSSAEVKHLSYAVHDSRDRSDVLLHATAVDRDQGAIRHDATDIAELGGGYGPYSKETLRLYASPNMTIKTVVAVAAKIAMVIDKALSANPNRPLISRVQE